MIPVSDAVTIGEKHKLRQVIIFGWDGRETFVTTWGGCDIDSGAAANAANHIKQQWNWPDNTIVEGARVQKLYDRIAALEAQLKLTVQQAADAADMAMEADCKYPGDYVVEALGYGQEQGAAAWRSS